MTQRRFVIGDVHGHYEALISLLDGISLNSEDEIYFLGDIIDRGPQSSQVVNFIIENGYNCLLGNHEVMLLDVLGTGDVVPQAFQAWLNSGGYATINSYGHEIPQEHIDWFRSLPLYIDLGDFWLVHAGIDPDLSIEEQTADQFCWIRDKFHSMTSPYFEDKLIITGHTVTFTFPGVRSGKLVLGEGWIDIETGVYNHNQGWLTALELNQSLVYQVNSFGKRFRQLSLARAVTQIKPEKIFDPRKKMLF